MSKSHPDSGLGDSSLGQPDRKADKINTVQVIIENIEKLNAGLSKAIGQIKSLPDASNNSRDHEEEDKNKDDHKDDKSRKAQFDQEKVKGELEKLCKELEFMKLAFQKLKKFEDDLIKPFKTLQKNVDDIDKDLQSAPNKYSSAKQVQINLRVLRNNITKIKIQIPLQHHATQTTSESRGYKETVASKVHEDLPNLSREELKLEEKSAYCRELFQKYEALKDERLKLCLLSFAVFPENAEVKKRLLRYWWVGEDIIPPKKGEKEFTDETLKTFVEMKFIEPVNKKNGLSTRSYRMYPIVRSALINLARKEQFFDYDPDGNPTMDFSKCYKACLVKPEEESSTSISKHFTKSEEELGNLETLFNVSEQFPDFKEEWFSKMKKIRVLYLGRWESSTNRHIEVESTICFKGLSNMKNLRFLSLQGISGIKTLPNSLCQAAKLRILDLRACHNLEELPDYIGSLKKLTHLDISECYLLDQMPKELSALSELEIFKGFVISDHVKSCSLEDLRALKKLEKLSINIIDKEYKAERLGTAISEFKSLKKLKVAWGGATLTPVGGDNRNNESDAAQSTISSQEKTKSSDNLSCFRRFGCVAFFMSKLRGAPRPNRAQDSKLVEDSKLAEDSKPKREVPKYKWENVEKLELQCYPETTPPSWLVPEVLHKLDNLYIKGGRLHNLPEIGIEPDSKWKAKILRLKYLSDLKTEWKQLREMFPDLEYLERVRCPKVMFCPCDGNGWCHLTTLLKDGVES